MNLTYNRHIVATLVVMLIVTAGLVIILFIVDVDPAQAITCGTEYISSYTCNAWCYYTGNTCPNGNDEIRCFRDWVYQMANPWSQKYGGDAGAGNICFPASSDCPVFCH